MVDERQILELSKRIDSLVNVEKIELDQPFDKYYSFNMSIIDVDSRIYSCFRNSNFLPKSRAQGKNSFLATADIVGNKMINLRPIKFRGFTTRIAEEYNAMEDPKLIKWRGDIWCLFVRPNRRITKIYPVLLNLRTSQAIFLDDPQGRPFSKNWMPFVDQDRLFFVTDLNPLRVYELKDGGLELHSILEKTFPFLVHGGSNIERFGDRLVGLVHGRFEYDDGRWFYWHAAASWDRSWGDMKIGKFFYFEKIGIEFSLSIMRKDDKIYIPYSVDDISMNIISMDLADFEVLV